MEHIIYRFILEFLNWQLGKAEMQMDSTRVDRLVIAIEAIEWELKCS